MKLKTLFTILIGIISIFPVTSRAGVVLNQPPTLTDAVLITDIYGNPEAVEVSGFFLDDCTQIMDHQITEMDNTLLIQVLVETTSSFCTPTSIPFTHVIEINSISEGLTISVGLYNGTAIQQGVVEMYGDLLVIEGVVSGTNNELPENIVVDITPAALNLKSKGRFITAVIDLPDEYDNENMILDNVKIASDIEAKKIILDKKGVFIAKFSRSEVVEYLTSLNIVPPAYVELSLVFQFSGDTTDLEVGAKDTIKVLH
jgi:hypothetical protein